MPIYCYLWYPYPLEIISVSKGFGRTLKMKRNRVRIIGGKWRSRQISFSDRAELRPTPDRIRETLFNWLSPSVENAHCLDLFAGSGVLGFEALSRGAALSVSLEKDPSSIQHLVENAATLKTDQMEIIQADAFAWLKTNPRPFNLVFVDPPYRLKSLALCFSLLEAYGWLDIESLIYFESDAEIQAIDLPASWIVLKAKKTSRLYYYLAQKIR